LVGITVQTSHGGAKEGIILYQNGKQMFLDKIEAAQLAETVHEARRRYWKRFRLPAMFEQVKIK